MTVGGQRIFVSALCLEDWKATHKTVDLVVRCNVWSAPSRRRRRRCWLYIGSRIRQHRFEGERITRSFEASAFACTPEGCFTDRILTLSFHGPPSATVSQLVTALRVSKEV